ncbi:Inhibitor of Bruton tyrosine kinase [Orchesella cincta]|uniref:Inhibitor of Bruton tyrosine kinase n=1 Tax=Orchesella cincta TaxID=48709 RepID=A0A1D2MWI4_ORCCI|nr:Inhibitor of Bruton tyrosine kinase [Orchesella cincta]
MASTSRSSPPSSPAPALQQKASSSQKHHVAEDDPCTDRCRSKEHGRRIWMIAQGSEDDSEVVALWSKTCLNYSQVRDDFGRTALHAAATNGLLKAAEWLVKIQQCNINAKDYISGYTPLHRSIYCGHLQVARSLIKLGADVNVRDNEGLTPFELCQMDRPIPFKQNAGDMTELTVWGSNANYNLGLGHQQPRLVPDVLEKFRKEDLSLVQVAMGTYQTMFLTKTGKVYACGYGMGGRLGTGNETTVLTPSLVHLKSACKIIAVGQDHTVFLTDNKVWTVGSNDFGQLGQPKECHKLLTPRTVNSLSKFQISGVLASSIHSVFYDQSVVIMCGANQGQFGKQTVSDRLQLESSQQMQQGLITTVSGNEQCTAICVENRYLYLLRRYQHARIDSRNTTSQKITKIEVSGEKDSITLFILTSSGRVLIWRENYNPSTKEHKGAFTRLVFSSNRLLDVKDFSVNQSSIVVITTLEKPTRQGGTTTIPQSSSAPWKSAIGPGWPLRLSVSSDVKGHNFSILQRHQIMDVTDIPYVGGSLMKDDILELYTTMVEGDGIHDLTFEVDSFHRFPAHAFILCSASPVFQKIIGDHLPTSAEEPVVIKVTNALFGIDPQKHLSLQDGKIFKAVLDMIYTSSCFVTSDEYILELRNCFLMDDERKGATFGEKLKDIMKMRQLCRALELEQAVEQLQEVLVQIDSNAFPQDVPKIRLPLSRHRFNRVEGDMCDVYLESSDKVLIQAHKCILVARVEYFRSMFSVNWSYGLPTASKSKPMSLPFSAKALLSVLDYVYTDKTVVNDGEFDLTWEAIACSDYMMLDRLLQIYECEMTKNINLKNVADILAFAWKHNSDQLRNTCFDFISLNLTAMLENKMLENLPNEIVVGLGSYYREVQARNLNYARTLHKRDEANIPNATDYSCALEMTPAEVLEQLQVIEETDAALLQKKSVSKPTKSRVRLRSRTLSESESLQDNDESNKELLLQIDCSIPENKLSTPLGSPAQAAFTPERKYIVPMPRNSMPVESPKPAKSPIKIDEFPSLGAAASSSPPTRGFTQPRRTSFEGSTQPTLAQSRDVNMQPLVAQGSSMASTSPSGSSNTPPQPIKQSPATASSSGAKKKTKWRAIKSDKDILSKSPVATVSGPSSPPALTSDGRDRNNPWKVKTTKQVTFKDIVDDEVEKRRNFEKAVSKPLKLMQIEDEAINVLTDMYTSEDTDDFIELLTVERVVASNVSAPTWVQHAGALATMMSPDTPI